MFNLLRSEIDHQFSVVPRTFLDYTWCIDIKQRAGCLSYTDDPLGFVSILAQTLTLDKANIWSSTLDNIDLFTNDDKVRNFVKHYLSKDKNVNEDICADCLVLLKRRKGVKNEPYMNKQCVCRKYSREEQEHVQRLSMVTYECVVKDILCALPIWTTFLKVIFFFFTKKLIIFFVNSKSKPSFSYFFTKNLIMLFCQLSKSSFPYLYLTMWGQYNIFYIMLCYDLVVIFTIDRLPDVNPSWEWNGC
jgi:hypothetical protein